MKRFVAVVAAFCGALVLAPLPAKAASIIGAGALSCGNWTADYETRDVGLWVDAAWLAGYLSAYTAYHPAGDVTKNLDPAARDAWVTNYCQAHPLDFIFQAADALIAELRARARLR